MKRKYRMVATVLSLMIALAAGCGSRTKEDRSTASLSTEETGESQKEAGDDAAGAGESTVDTEQTDQNQDVNVNQAEESKAEGDAGSQDKILIGGKVRSVAQDSFVLSLTLWEDSEDGTGAYNVVIPEPGSPEEELVTVRCADSAVYERWTIEEGGAGIQKDEASFSEIIEGGGLEAEGHYEGEEFVADKVIIEIYK